MDEARNLLRAAPRNLGTDRHGQFSEVRSKDLSKSYAKPDDRRDWDPVRIALAARSATGRQRLRAILISHFAMWRTSPPAGVLLSARATAATTLVDGGSDTLRFSGPMTSTAFAIDAAHRLGGGTVTLGLSSPLRLERARAVVEAPVAYDLITGVLATRLTSVDLTPSAREMDVELGWSAALSPSSSLRLGVAQAFDAGHVAGAKDTAGFVALVLR